MISYGERLDAPTGYLLCRRLACGSTGIAVGREGQMSEKAHVSVHAALPSVPAPSRLGAVIEWALLALGVAYRVASLHAGTSGTSAWCMAESRALEDLWRVLKATVAANRVEETYKTVETLAAPAISWLDGCLLEAGLARCARRSSTFDWPPAQAVVTRRRGASTGDRAVRRLGALGHGTGAGGAPSRIASNSRICRSRLKRARADSRPARPIAARRSGSRRRASIASTNAA